MRRFILPPMPAIVLTAALAIAVPTFAQNSDFNLNVHANPHATAESIGLPVYPGATPFKDKDSDSSSADVGFFLNSFHFSIKAASFVTSDSPQRVLDFYRKPLAKFGEVLECDHGKPVGSLTVTKTGLTCGDNKDHNNAGSTDRELRAGTPLQFRVVGIDHTDNGKTRFGLVALVLPKDDTTR